MSERQSPSPRFKRPPVAETILGVFFRPLDKFSLIRRVSLWSQHFAEQFPNVEDRLPLDEVREEFGDGALAPGSQVQVRWQMAAPSPRIWAKSQDEKHTIQIQHDAFIANWERDPAQSVEYMNYDMRKRDFGSKLRKIDQYARDESVGNIEPTSCFVTYINHIELSESASFADELQRLLTIWRNETSDKWLPPVETASQKLAFAMPGNKGRLHVTVAQAVRHRDQKRIIRIDLTARGTPDAATIDGALDWLDLGHDWVVRGFASLTTAEMHKQWERVQ